MAGDRWGILPNSYPFCVIEDVLVMLMSCMECGE